MNYHAFEPTIAYNSLAANFRHLNLFDELGVQDAQLTN